jgi:hypothetical protein
VQPSRRMPRGSGNRRYGWWNRFMNPVVQPPNESATNKMLVGETFDYKQSFAVFLGDNTISSYFIEADSGLTIVSSSNDDPIISYRIKAVTGSYGNVWQQVKIQVTDSIGRVDIKVINFEVVTPPVIA